MTKKQHFLPKAYLAGFQVADGFYGLSLSDGKAFATRPDDVCTANYLYETEYKHTSPSHDAGADRFVDPNAIERAISVMESRFIKAIRDVDDHCVKARISDGELLDRTNVVLEFALHVIARNPRALGDLSEIVREGLGEHLLTKAVRKSIQLGQPDECDAVETEIAKRFFLVEGEGGYFLKNETIRWQNCKRFIFAAPQGKAFIVSDFPICGFGRNGELETMLLPISAHAAVAFYAKDSAVAHCYCAMTAAEDVDALNAIQLVVRPRRKYLFGPDEPYLLSLYETYIAGTLMFADLLSLDVL